MIVFWQITFNMLLLSDKKISMSLLKTISIDKKNYISNEIISFNFMY